ncbi:family 20 glycosylhydrolase [Pedobacter polysacchareus]|uniref:family 20 glycosylhydrolase n=1 Tax=Pedobacter polysacchareus TaxID=2861973 RepID=UPI001C992CD6|nr:family 20 glycosylhydrolase [Pedobacter polysacchareus]
MKKIYLLLFALLTAGLTAVFAQKAAQQVSPVTELFPVRALLLSTPDPEDVPMFCDFITDVLPKEGVNTLVLRINYKYQFETHPELAGHNALSKKNLQKILKACKTAGIRLIPKMNLLGHQSEDVSMLPLLKNYPQFDESPALNPPVPWKPANTMFDFYAKSLCPKHPDLFKIIFPVIDELIDVCGADAFHVGLDEVWIIGDEKCPRCGGLDKAEIFATYVTALHDHLKQKGCEMWMWSDRLIDGKTTNLLAWQASMNHTHRAIDLIPKDIMICDWKYEDAAPTPAYFAIKGFNVLAAPSNKAEVGLAQLDLVRAIRKNGNRAEFSSTISNRMQGMFHTMWGNSKDFILAYHGKQADKDGTVNTFKKLFAEIRTLKSN